MKKSLLATTALAALGAVAVASPASAKFEVGISGYMEQWFGYSDNGNSTLDNSDVFDQVSDSEFFVKGKQTLDNGLVIGFDIQVEGQQPAGEIDEQYIFIDGSFGRIELGTDNAAPYRMHYGVASKGIGIDEGDVRVWVAGAENDLRATSTTANIDNDANKITYFSPRVNGFQIGASYMPNSDDVNATTPQTAGQEADGSRDNGYGIAANYVNSFDAVSLKVSVGYMDAGKDPNAVGNEEALAAGLQLGFGGFTASVAYGEYQRDDGTAADVNNFGVGLAYAAGPAGVSIGYVRGEDSDSNEDQDAFELGASYSMGPGVTAKGSIYYIENTTNGVNTAEGIGVVGGLALSF